MTIRERTAADLDACVAALREVHEASGYPTRWPADPAGWLTPEGQLQAWIAEDGGDVLGHVVLMAGSAEPGLAAATGLSVDELALVSRLYVAPAGRSRGLARALIATLVEHAATLGLRVGLDVIETSHDAISLYESLGWQFHGRERARWRTQRGEHPMIRYYLAPG